MKLLALAASHRAESINRKTLLVVAGCAQATGAQIKEIPYGVLNAPVYDDEQFDERAIPDAVEHFVGLLNECDGVLLASPEYNWSFPGSLKNLIDWVSVIKPNPLAKKPFLLMSASPSMRGGAEGLVQLRTPLAALGAYVYPKLFTLSQADSLFEADGKLKNAYLQQDIMKLVEDFLQFAKKMA